MIIKDNYILFDQNTNVHLEESNMHEISLTDYKMESFDSALDLFKNYSTKSGEYNSTHIPPIYAENKDFGSDFLGSLIHRPHYINCRFHNSKFQASNGAFSVFEACYFYDCYLEDANLNYCQFTDCQFIKKEHFDIKGTGFNFSDFSKIIFQGIDFKGVSFRDINLNGCTYDGCTISNSSFERAEIKNCSFKNMDFRNAGIRYCKFSDVIFENVTFPILDLVNNIGLVRIFENQQDQVCFSLGNNGTVSLEKAKKLLLQIEPYYKGTGEYFSLINLYMINGFTEKAKELIKEALEYSVKQHNFETLRNICDLIVSLDIFDASQLRDIYERIKITVDPEKLPYNLQKGHLIYMDNIKNILLDNPFGYPCGRIELSTNIEIDEQEKLVSLLKDIEKVITSVDPQISPCLQITHHSPFDILIIIYSKLPEILLVCQIFYYSFGGYKLFDDIKNNRHESATNNDSGNVKADGILTEERAQSLNFSIGPIHFQKESKSFVKKVEYFIH